MRIIINNKSFNITNYNPYLNLRKDEWSNCLPVSFNMRISKEDLDSIKKDSYVDNSWYDFNFNLIKDVSEGNSRLDPGFYNCESKINSIRILSKFPDGFFICKIDTTIWDISPMSEVDSTELLLREKMYSRDLLLNGLGI